MTNPETNPLSAARVCGRDACPQPVVGRNVYCSPACRAAAKKQRQRGSAPRTDDRLVVAAQRLAAGQSQAAGRAAAERAAVIAQQRLAVVAGELATVRVELVDRDRLIGQLREDATWLAGQLALVYRSRDWSGFTGQVEVVVDRYVETGR